jgi:hypothetical protein
MIEKNSGAGLFFFHPIFAPHRKAAQKIREVQSYLRSSTQTIPDKVVLNHITTTELKAIINFGQAKMKLFTNIYNWRVSFPNEKIFLMLADITACFWFPKISADVTGAFGFLAKGFYFLSMGYIFSSNTSASSWEALRRAIQIMIIVYSQ